MYKRSNYNYFINDTNQVIYYNGITSAVFAVTENEDSKLQILLNDLAHFETAYPLFFKKFIEWGFVIDDNKDELDFIRAKHRLAAIESRDYNLIINPTQECNFNCWYCYESHPQGYMTEETIEKIKKHIRQMIEVRRITSLNIGWFGGEPLLYFNEVVYPISLYAKKLCKKYKIPFSSAATTNASKIDLKMIEKMNEIDLNHFQITLDGGAQRHNRIRNEKGKPSFDTIIQNILLLCQHKNKVKINLRINYDNQTLNDESLVAVFKQIPPKHRKLITVDFQRVWQTTRQNTASLTHIAQPEQNTTITSSFITENSQKLNLHHLCQDLGYRKILPTAVFGIALTHKCYADRYYYAHINYDGKVYSCTARDYSDKYVFGQLENNGSIAWRQDKIVKKIAKATFENPMCLSCKYLPLCMGPCSQTIMEITQDNLHNACYLQKTEIKPETVIIDFYNNHTSQL